MEQDRRLFIHCGLHKTGSTSVQRALPGLAGKLEDRGLYLPREFSKNRGAHHGLAYALKGPAVFRREGEKFQNMIAEMRGFQGNDFCISSEDFESYLARPRALKRLLSICPEISVRPVFVIYLRNQIDYFESLYLQLLRHGYSRSVTQTLDEILSTGSLAWRKWVFHFDYAAMAASLHATAPDPVLRNYHELEGGSSISDFLTVLERPGLVAPEKTELRANQARVERNVRRFIVNRLGEELAPPAEELDTVIDGRRPRLSDAARRRFAERFGAGNASIETDYGVRLNQYGPVQPPVAGTPVLDAIFEDDTTDAIAQLHNMAGTDNTGRDLRDRICENWFAGGAGKAEAAARGAPVN